jgi:hypothetical protein
VAAPVGRFPDLDVRFTISQATVTEQRADAHEHVADGARPATIRRRQRGGATTAVIGSALRDETPPYWTVR